MVVENTDCPRKTQKKYVYDSFPESMAHLLFGPMTQASVALGAAIDPDHVRRVYAESLERLLDGLERG